MVQTDSHRHSPWRIKTTLLPADSFLMFWHSYDVKNTQRWFVSSSDVEIDDRHHTQGEKTNILESKSFLYQFLSSIKTHPNLSLLPPLVDSASHAIHTPASLHKPLKYNHPDTLHLHRQKQLSYHFELTHSKRIDYNDLQYRAERK